MVARLALVALLAVGCGVTARGLATQRDGGQQPEAGAGDGLIINERPVDALIVSPADAPLMPDRQADRAADFSVDLPRDRSAAADAALNGVTCSADGQCASGFCVDGVCCENRCMGTCMGCVRAQTGLENGFCRFATIRTDPSNDCPDEFVSSCKRNGFCDGAGRCALYPAGLTCGPATCNGSSLSGVARCTGGGACMAGPSQNCPGGLICQDAASCKARCAGDGDCVGGLTCDLPSGVCKNVDPKKTNGQTCNMALGGGDCLSTFCVDGLCCDAACTGACRACSAAKTGAPDGTCGQAPAGSDPDDECPTDAVGSCGRDGFCDGVGACRLYPDGMQCGSDCCPSGGGARPCTFACKGGSCDRGNPMETDRCRGQDCCCPTGGAGGVAACVPATTCAAGTCQ